MRVSRYVRLHSAHSSASHYHSEQPGEGGYGFIGNEIPAKEWECVLVYDEDSGVGTPTMYYLVINSTLISQRFTLEKLDSCVTLTYDRKTATGPKHTASRMFS